MQKGPHHLPVAPYVIYDAILKALPDDYDENEERLEALWEKEGGVALVTQLAPMLKDLLDPANFSKRRSNNIKRLKTLIRAGIPASLRADLYPILAQVESYADNTSDFRAGLQRVYGANVPLKPIIPELGEAFDITRYPYQDGGTMNVLLILCIFATDHPEVDFCPYVPSLAATLCIFLPNNDVLGCLSSFVRQSGRNMWAYIPVGQKECHLFSLVFLELVRRNMPSFVKHLSRHNLSLPDWRFFWMRTFASLFLDVLRLPTTLRVIDALFLEGSKIFIRTGLGLLLSLEKPLLQCTNFAQMEKAIKTAGQSPDLDVDGVFSLGFRVPISRAEILQMRFRLLSQVDLQLRPIVAYQKPVPELSEPSLIVDPDMLQRLWSWMPQRFRIRNMELLFCTQQHGYSLQTLFKNNGDCEATIMFVKTTKGAVFGAFLTQSWMHRKPRHYFGTGESFLFSLVPEHTVYYWARIESVADGGGHVRFRAGSAVDRVPSFFQLAERDFLAIGGGAKGPGLWLDASLLKGKSNPSETFNNKPLHGSDDDEFFECAIVELYGIV